jgi:Ser/Thr protein kinase RdoA (MazF antagonist)
VSLHADSLSIERREAAAAGTANAALASFDLHGGVVSLIRLGENAVFRVGSSRGVFALRVHRQGYRSSAQIESEMALMAHLARAGIDVPVPLVGKDGQAVQHVPGPDGITRVVSVLSWVDGTQLDTAVEPDVALPLLGRALAKVHEAAKTFIPDGWFVRPVWDAEGLIGTGAELGDFRAVEVSSSRRELFTRAAEVIDARLAVKDGYGLVHGDLMENNAMMVGNRCVLIDFDDCGLGWFAYDIATMRFRGHHVLEHADWRAAVLDGYRSVREFTEADEQRLPALWAARTLSFVGWLTDRGELADIHRARILDRAAAVCDSLLQQSV